MKQQLICVNSDAINRDYTFFPLNTLEKSLREIYAKGMTMCIGHDLHRPVGWVIPFGIYIEPKLSRVFAKRMIAVSSEDYDQIYSAHQNYVLKKYAESFNEVAQPFLNIIGKHLSENHFKLQAGCPAIYDEGLVEKCFPGIFENSDKNGLLSIPEILKSFDYLGQGVFKDKKSDLAIYAHRYFRRSQSVHNNFHFAFLDELLKQSSNPEVTTKIRIDDNMVGFAPAFHHSLEHEYHYGPKYTDEIDKIKFGITRHVTDDFERDYYGINRSEFLWKHDEDEMTFETEELRDKPSLFESTDDEVYNCRYVHSIYNSKIADFVHFDGAIRSYSMEEMSDRLDKDFLEYGRKARYTKLFRIDGKLTLSSWKLLVTHYLQGNPLVYEYFGAGEEYQSLKETATAIKELSLEEEYIPFAIKRGDGVRLMVSYHAITADLEPGRYVEIYDQMSSEEGTIYCAEHLLYEVQKALVKEGEELRISETITKIKCADRYWNIPCIMHNSDNPAEALSATKKAILKLLRAMFQQKIDLDIAFTLAIPINERIVRISSYGNIADQINWLETQSEIIASDEKFGNWVLEQQEYLSKFPVQPDCPISSSMIQFDGVLFLKRKPVLFDCDYELTDEGLKYEMKLPDDPELMKLIEEKRIEPVLLIDLIEARWSDTGKDYYEGDRSKWLDDNNGAKVHIIKADPLRLYWSKTAITTRVSNFKSNY